MTKELKYNDKLSRKTKILNENNMNNYAKISFGCLKKVKCVVKSIKKSSKYSMKKFEQEINILNKLKETNNIITLFGYDEDSEYYHIIMERGNVDLAVFRMMYEMNETHINIILYKLLCVINVIHNMGIIHMDLKLQNIVFTNENYYNPVLIDFGDSIISNKNIKYNNKYLIGTPNYISPEKILYTQMNHELYKKSDLWSIGVVCYELICGNHCFDGQNNQIIFKKIINQKWTWNFNSIDYIPTKYAIDFVSKCLTMNPNKRWNSKEALQHVWFKSI
mmetsp:Transcript_89931/g.110109  ORF Transcript_89931/g.110109 Transcript_89931/m.110109 type:complete len:277 (+) Transcript_89931:28-858(+)